MPGCRLGVVGVVRGRHVVVLGWRVVVCGRRVVICGWWAGLWVVDSFAGGAGRSWVGGRCSWAGLMFVGGGCRSGMGGRLFVMLSSCCVVCVVAVRKGWETEGYSLERPRR